MRFTTANMNAVDHPTNISTGEALDPCQHSPGRAEDDVAEADGRVGGDGEVDRRLQVRRLARSPEDESPENDLNQMKHNDQHEEAQEKANFSSDVRGLDGVTDAERATG